MHMHTLYETSTSSDLIGLFLLVSSFHLHKAWFGWCLYVTLSKLLLCIFLNNFPLKVFLQYIYLLWWQGVSRWAHSLGMWGIFKIAWTWSCPGPSAELVILFILICFDLWCGFYPLYVTSAPYLSLLLLNTVLLHKYKRINSHTNTLQPTTSLYRNSPYIRSL